MKALVVDDSHVSRRLVAQLLREHCGFGEVVQAQDGPQALALTGQFDFDLILLDWNMPNMQGIDVLRKIRASGNRTPTIMVTSETERARVMEAIGAGANDYVIKPIQILSFVEKVRRVIDRVRQLSIQRHTRKALVVDDSGTSRRLFRGVLRDQCGFDHIVEAADGCEAVQAVKGSDFDLILLDWNMPTMQGIDALKAIRGLGKKTPIIMVTSENEGSRVIEAFDAGADNYIIKPFEPSSLAGKIRQVLHI